MAERTDSERLDWLASKAHSGISLLEDDHGRWAVVGDGIQPLTHVYEDDGREARILDEPIPGTWTYFVESADQWHDDPRSAIDAAMDAEAADADGRC